MTSCVVDSTSGPVNRQLSDGAVTGRNTTVAFDHDARHGNSYQFDSRDSARQTRSVSSVSGDSYDDAQKLNHTGSSHGKSDHDKVRAHGCCLNSLCDSRC